MSPDSKHSLQHDAEREASRKRPNALGYLAVMFAAALLLLVLAYVMQQRSNEATLTGLTQSISAMRSVENLLAENDALQDNVASLHDEAAALQGTIDQLQTVIDEQSGQIDAMAREIRRLTDELAALTDAQEPTP